MKLCKYWAMAEGLSEDANGQKLILKKWGGSNTSMAEAKADAERVLRELQDRVRAVKIRSGWDRGYTYSMRDVPEELISPIDDKNGVTRNGKGCLVLNSSEAMFADIDLPRLGFFAKLFGTTKEKQEQQAIDALRKWLETKPDYSVRVYRTRAGLRYLFTHAPMEVSDETLQMLKELKSDRLYITMCRNQKCFRARLTPKPFRLRCGTPPGHYPYPDDTAAKQFEAWKAIYDQQSKDVATCQFIDTVGSGRVDSKISKLVELHDRYAKAGSNLPLA